MTNEHLRTSRGKNDECYTERYAVEPLLEFMQPYKDKIIWCPFDDETSEFVIILYFKEEEKICLIDDTLEECYK